MASSRDASDKKIRAWAAAATIFRRALTEAGTAIDGWRVHRRIGMSGGYGADELSRAERLYSNSLSCHEG